MTELQKTLSWAVRLKRAFGMSFFASVFAGIAGVLAFGIFASFFMPHGADRPIVDQDFFLVIVNVLPMSVALGLLSFFAQLAAKPVLLDLAMLCVAIVLLVGLLSMYYNYADPSSVSDKIYLAGALVPGLIMIVVHWLFFRLSTANGRSHAMRGAL